MLNIITVKADKIKQIDISSASTVCLSRNAFQAEERDGMNYVNQLRKISGSIHLLCVFRFTKLIKDGDGPDYNKNNFNDLRLSHFLFVIMTKNPFPDDELIERTYPIRIHIPVQQIHR